MSSTDLEAPSRKLLLTAIIIVVGLHVLTAIALAAVKTPELKVDKKETPPIEIELITLPPPSPTEVEAVNLEEEEPKPAPQVKEQPPVPKAKPVAKPTPKAPAKPVVKEEKITPKAAPKVPVEKQKTEEKPKEPPVDPRIAEAAANEQRRIIAAEAERAAQQAQAQKAQADRDAKAARDAQVAADAKAAREAAEVAAQAKAARDAEAAAQAKAARDAEAAASNTPQNFTATNADWASAPRFSFPDRAARNARSGETFTVVLRLRVNKQGGIDGVSLSKSSGNTAVDKEAQRQVRSGKFRPFTKNGVPVVGNVTLPVSYQVP